MSKQPEEALRLADALDRDRFDEPHGAAAELRRLHAVNGGLLEALKSIESMYDYKASIGELTSRLYEACCISRAAINKAGDVK
jgi:hypothetical protein